MQRGRQPDSRNFRQLASLRVELLARQSRRHADADYRRKIGLGVLQCRIIGIVGSQGPLTFRELCAGTDIEKTYASRLVAKLTAFGLLRKLPDAADQRSFVIAVTTAGRRAYDRIYRIAQERNESWLAALSREQRETFFACLDILALASRKLTAGARPSSGTVRGARHGAPKRPAGTVGRPVKQANATSTRSNVATAPNPAETKNLPIKLSGAHS
jgi:DNA-binding MarR family transcriptional regulator